jgi:predicted double-glycine peptidase
MIHRSKLLFESDDENHSAGLASEILAGTFNPWTDDSRVHLDAMFHGSVPTLLNIKAKKPGHKLGYTALMGFLSWVPGGTGNKHFLTTARTGAGEHMFKRAESGGLIRRVAANVPYDTYEVIGDPEAELHRIAGTQPEQSQQSSQQRVESALTEAESFFGLPVPRTKQQSTSSCGSASLLGVLKFFNRTSQNTSDETAKQALNFGSTGADITRLEAAAKLAGLKTVRGSNSNLKALLAELRRGRPVIVCVQAWPTRQSRSLTKWGHYVVLVGADKDNLYFMDPAEIAGTGYTWMPQSEFDRVWTSPYANLHRAYLALYDEKRSAAPRNLFANTRLETPRTPED